MTLQEARALRVGQRVRFDTGKDPKKQYSDPPCSGVIVAQTLNIVAILWDDGKRCEVQIHDSPVGAAYWENIHLGDLQCAVKSTIPS